MNDTASTDATATPPRELLILAMDHRDSLEKHIYKIDGKPTSDDTARISGDKSLVFDGLLRAISNGVDKCIVGVLVDEEYGKDVATRAKDAGIDLAMPIEKSGQDWFTLEYGTLGDSQWKQHIERFNPNQVKVLVRDNPDLDASHRQAQFEHLAEVSRALSEAGRTFLVELIVPATDEQLASVDKDALRYDRDVRPGLTVTVIGEAQAAGVLPNVWKVEGLETQQAAQDIVAAAQAGGRDDVVCIVLGRDAPTDRLDHWLSVAGGVQGFRGFAIGRSVWQDPLVDKLEGKIDDAQLIAAVAANFSHFVDVYTAAKKSA